MSTRALVTLVALALLATGGGVAGGLMLARAPELPAAAAPTTPTAPPTTEPEEPASSSSTAASSSSTSTTAGLAVRARLLQRLEDGLVVRYDASEPVTAVLAWGFGGPGGNQLPFPGPAARGTVRLPLAETSRAIAVRVVGRSADGRQAASGTLVARRLVRRVVLEVRALRLSLQQGTAGIATGFLGTTYTPIGPQARGPQATAAPFAFPSVALAAGAAGSPLALRFFHQVRPDPQRTRVVNLAISYPSPGTAVTLTRTVTAVGVTASLTLRVRVTRS